MRILLVSFVGNNRWSGMGKWTHSIARECERQGHTISMWFEDEFPRLRRLGRLAVLLFPLWLVWEVWRRRKQFDVIVIHEPSAYWYAWMRRIFSGLPPLIVMSHGVESRRFALLLDATRRGLAAVSPGSRWKAPALRLWQSDGALRRADHVICLSSLDRDYLVSRLEVSPETISLMINGVDQADFRPAAHRQFAERVLFVASWLDAKGSMTLPSLWSKTRATRPHARLTLVGTGFGEETVRSAFPVEDRESIEVIPRITGLDEMTRQFAAHDIFLMPSLNEGSPLSLLEAMSAGLPVVAGAAGGIPDIISDGENGLLFDPLDSAAGATQLIRLLEDDRLRERLSAGAQARAHQLDWEQAAGVLLDAGRRVTHKSAQGQEGSRVGRVPQTDPEGVERAGRVSSVSEGGPRV